MAYVDLSDADLTGADLTGAVTWGAKLTGAVGIDESQVETVRPTRPDERQDLGSVLVESAQVAGALAGMGANARAADVVR